MYATHIKSAAGGGGGADEAERGFVSFSEEGAWGRSEASEGGEALLGCARGWEVMTFTASRVIKSVV